MPAAPLPDAGDPVAAPGDLLVVRGGRPLVGGAPLVGDKSISHRALLLGALADGPTEISNLSPCADLARTRAALEALGVTMTPTSPTGLRVDGRGVAGLGGPAVTIDCGDSGTTMRLLAGLLAGQDRVFVLSGAPGLLRRPMARVVVPLRSLGAAVDATEGRAPIVGRGGGLRGGAVALARASAQVGGALLLAGLNAAGPVTVHYPAPVRDHTERLLAAMGAPLRWDGAASRLDGPVARLAPPAGGHLEIPDDPSAAAFLLAAATLLPGSRVSLPGVGMNEGRTGFLEVLAAMGAPVAVSDWSLAGAEPRARLEARPAPLTATTIAGPLVPRCIDELPVLAVLASQAEGRTAIRDAAELRVKESDRIEAIAEGLARLGAELSPTADGLVIDGPRRLRGATLDGHEDHRIVMALAIAGLAAEGETVITGARRLADSFPGFVTSLRALGADLELR